MVVASGLRPILVACGLEQNGNIENELEEKEEKQGCFNKIREKIVGFHKKIMVPTFLRENKPDIREIKNESENKENTERNGENLKMPDVKIENVNDANNTDETTYLLV